MYEKKTKKTKHCQADKITISVQLFFLYGSNMQEICGFFVTEKESRNFCTHSNSTQPDHYYKHEKYQAKKFLEKKVLV